MPLWMIFEEQTCRTTDSLDALNCKVAHALPMNDEHTQQRFRLRSWHTPSRVYEGRRFLSHRSLRCRSPSYHPLRLAIPWLWSPSLPKVGQASMKCMHALQISGRSRVRILLCPYRSWRGNPERSDGQTQTCHWCWWLWNRYNTR